VFTTLELALWHRGDRHRPAPTGLAPAALKPTAHRYRNRTFIAARLNCVGADADQWRGVGHEQQKPQPARSSPALRPSLAAVAATLPTPLRGVAARQHNVALCKPPRCHGACETSSPRAGTSTRRASASLRITHIHVNGRQALRAGHRVPTHPRRPRAHPCARRCGHFAALRVDRCRRFVACIATRLHACCARLHGRVRAARPRSHLHVCSRVGLTLRVQAEPASLLR